MASRRPVPLSDDVFAPMLLGSASAGGAAYPTKHTFINFSPGITPNAMQGGQHSLLTAPANLVGRLGRLGLFGSAPPSPGSPSRADEPLDPSPTTAEDETPTTAEDVSPTTVDEDDYDDDDNEDGLVPMPPIILDQVPRPPPGALHPSVGSVGHATGACRRCCFFPRGRCANGYACSFCHYEHDRRRRKNTRIKKRVVWPTVGPAALQPRAHGLFSSQATDGAVAQQSAYTMPVVVHMIRPAQPQLMMYNGVQAGPQNMSAPVGLPAAPAPPSQQIIRLMPAMAQQQPQQFRGMFL